MALGGAMGALVLQLCVVVTAGLRSSTGDLAPPTLVEAAPWESGDFDLQGTWIGASTGNRYIFTRLGDSPDVVLDLYPYNSLSTDGWILTPASPRGSSALCFESMNKYSVFMGAHSLWCIGPASRLPDQEACMNIGPHEDLCRRLPDTIASHAEGRGASAAFERPSALIK